MHLKNSPFNIYYYQRPATVGGAAENIYVDEESEENVSEEEGDIDEDVMDID